jgi:LemA protein
MIYSTPIVSILIRWRRQLSGLVAIIIVILLLIIVVLWFIGAYNKLVGLRNRVDNQWAQIDVQLRRRYDLIPNLVETVKGYAAHERQTLEAVVSARQMGIDAKTVAEQGQAENMLTGALRQIFALSEAYPTLKANENFIQLQGQLTELEGAIATTRQSYNDSVLNYNNAVQMFPSNIVAGMSGFGLRDLFEITAPEMREPPRVQF